MAEGWTDPPRSRGRSCSGCALRIETALAVSRSRVVELANFSYQAMRGSTSIARAHPWYSARQHRRREPGKRRPCRASLSGWKNSAMMLRSWRAWRAVDANSLALQSEFGVWQPRGHASAGVSNAPSDEDRWRSRRAGPRVWHLAGSQAATYFGREKFRVAASTSSAHPRRLRQAQPCDVVYHAFR